VPLDESYSKAEKDSAMDAFAMSLLLSRDEKLKTHSFRGNNSIIALVAEELGEHTYLSKVSHKSHQSYIMNMSNHSLNSVEEGLSPVGRIFSKFSALTALGHSRVSVGSVVPVDNREMIKIISPELDSRPFSPTELTTGTSATSDQEQNMSMREWIVAKKRGSIGDDGNGLNYARRGSMNTGDQHQAQHSQQELHNRQRSDNFDEALGRVMALESGFGKGPASFGVQESDSQKYGASAVVDRLQPDESHLFSAANVAGRIHK
jgi:hypothetical protein